MLSEFLARNGYRVFLTTSSVSAYGLLREKHIDLAIIDLRLVNDDDRGDWSGVVFAWSIEPSTPKIILVESSDVSAVRAHPSLRPSLNGPQDIEFAAKTEGLEALLQTVEEMLLRFPPNSIDLKENPTKKLEAAA